MSRTRLLLATMLFSCATTVVAFAVQAAGPSGPQADVNLLTSTIRANRKALIEASLMLTDEQAGKFWPIYDRYQKEMAAVNDRIAALVEDYSAHFKDLSNDKALQLTGDYLAAEADRLQVRRTYLAEFAKVLPGRTVARFYQIENKMDAVLRYDLASTIPVVDSIGGKAN
jgi:Spy/CpxP family protein refolding chaperone